MILRCNLLLQYGFLVSTIFPVALFGQNYGDEKTVTAINKLKCTASWDGTKPGNCSKSAEYSPPPYWIIVNHEINEKSDNNGSYSVNILNQGGRLKANVSAKAHGSVFDRKRGWMKISVNATIRYSKEPEPEIDLTTTQESNEAENPNGKSTSPVPINEKSDIDGSSRMTLYAALIGAAATIFAAWLTVHFGRNKKRKMNR